jgi:predicted  nucleic acid-binding Zn-ribbon protein
MPHECTACGRTFADGSKEMLSGCPDCGGTKFQFRPRTEAGDGAAPSDPSADDGPEVTGREWPMHGDEPTDERRTRGRVGSRARDAPADDDSTSTREDPASTRDDLPSTRTDDSTAEDGPATAPDGPTTTDDGIVVADEEPISPEDEDSAQADARSGVAAPDEEAQGAAPPDDPGPDADSSPPDDGDDTPDLSALREELNDQFESIKIVSPGQYELNLMELYEREEHIISLREDGRYVIEVPETWRSG